MQHSYLFQEDCFLVPFVHFALYNLLLQGLRHVFAAAAVLAAAVLVAVAAATLAAAAAAAA